MWTWADGTKNWLRWAIVPGTTVKVKLLGLSFQPKILPKASAQRKSFVFKDELLHLTSEIAKVGGWEFDPVTW